MTPEQKREQLLKRLLPALLITVIYFVFISNFIGEQKDKAEASYIQLMQKGVSPSNIPSMNKQIQQTRKQINSLQKKKQQLQNQIKEMAGFIAGDESSTRTAGKLAKILADNRVRVTKEESLTLEEEQLPAAVKDIKKWLLPDTAINTQHLELRGSYLAMFNALRQMQESQLQSLPIIFKMNTPEDDSDFSGGNELQWELVLWM